jgi:hypothetical protein
MQQNVPLALIRCMRSHVIPDLEQRTVPRHTGIVDDNIDAA